MSNRHLKVRQTTLHVVGGATFRFVPIVVVTTATLQRPPTTIIIVILGSGGLTSRRRRRRSGGIDVCIFVRLAFRGSTGSASGNIPSSCCSMGSRRRDYG